MRIAALVLFSMFAGQVLATPVVSLYVHPAGGAGAGYTGSVFEVADEFTVPAGQTWRITGVINDGFAAPASTYQVTFYANGGGIPGSSLCMRTGVPPRGVYIPAVDQIQNPEFRLSPACVLTQGTYFFAQRNTTVSGNTQINTTPTIVGNEMRIRSTTNSTCGNSFVPVSSCLGAPQDLRFTVLGCQAATCEFALASGATCVGNDLVVNIDDGDANFNVTGTGPGLPRNNVGGGNQTFTGPGLWETLTVTEIGGDTQSQSFGFRNCGTRAVTVAPSGGSTTVDEGNPAATDSYTLVLASPPNPGETVTIDPTSNVITGVTTSPPTVVFTTANWSVPQTVIVTVVDDNVLETGAQTDTIAHPLSTSGGVYTGVIVAPVIVTIIDDDEVILKDGFEG